MPRPTRRYRLGCSLVLKKLIIQLLSLLHRKAGAGSDNLGTFPYDTLIAFTKTEKFAAKKPEYYEFLEESDARLKQMVTYLKTHVRPGDPVQGGSVEFGIIPYWVKNPPPGLPEVIRKFLDFLEEHELVPAPTVNENDYRVLCKNIEQGTAVANDGTLFGFGKYEQLDTGWLEAPFNEALTDAFGKAPFGQKRPYVGPLQGKDPGNIRVAILGDWGTGTSVAASQAVFRQALEQNPDYLIHLGDVYYTGSPNTKWPPYAGEDKEYENFINLWSACPKSVISFTLNSNHEMYCGAHGYFENALTAPPFRTQNGKSYFLLENDHWQIFGLDSAYDSPYVLYMKGALNDEQTHFVQSHVHPHKRVIVFTHHTGLVNDGTQYESLWNDVKTALNGNSPHYWYWGHIHNGIVYSNRTPAGSATRARCVGHSAFPFGLAWGLTKPRSKPTPIDYIETVEFFAHESAGDDHPGRMKNGFALIELKGSSINETFYDEDGKTVWPPAS